ncbi:MAG: flavodoxin [Bacillota bacterium]|nr:flavodoxin [Bacillota bacterium]MDW7677042.1 flavodoxin [Bacillota bacterium]
MKIAIIVYSRTGHTLSVAQKIQEKLAEKDHLAHIEQVTITGEASPGKFEITGKPAVDDYDALIFGAPVQAFSLCTVMDAYLRELPSLVGKKAAFLVTKQLPFAWTGGNRAIKSMRTICEDKGAQTLGAGIACWKEEKREQSVDECVEKIAWLF